MLNFQDFKKIKEDEKTATMQHNKGHKITIVKSALPAIQREALKRLKLADSEPVKEYEKGSENGPVSQDDAAPVQQIVSQDSSQIPVAPDTARYGVTAEGKGGAAGPIEAEQKGLNRQQEIDTAKAPYQASTAAEALQKTQDLQAQIQQNIAETKKPVDDYAAFIRANPSKGRAEILADRSTGTKLANTLGLMLGGFAPGGVNPAAQMIDKMVDSEVDRQKREVDNQKSIYGAYHQLYQDDKIATELTKASIRDEIAAKTDQLNAQFATPQAEAATLRLKGELGKKNAESFGISGTSLTDLKRGARAPVPAPGWGHGPSTAPSEAPAVTPAGGATKPSGLKSAVGAGVGALMSNGMYDPNHDVKNMKAGDDPRGWAKENQKEEPYVAPGTSKMLRPSAASAIANLKYDHQTPQDQKDLMLKEYEHQTNAEAGLAAIDKVYPELVKNATLGSWVENKGTSLLHAVNSTAGALGTAATGLGLAKYAGLIGKGGAAVAKGAGEAAGSAMAVPALAMAGIATAYGYMTREQRAEYDANREKLRSALGQALAHVPAYGSTGAMDQLLDDVTPTVFDSKRGVDAKVEAAKDIIRLHNTSTALKARGHSSN